MGTCGVGGGVGLVGLVMGGGFTQSDWFHCVCSFFFLFVCLFQIPAFLLRPLPPQDMGGASEQQGGCGPRQRGRASRVPRAQVELEAEAEAVLGVWPRSPLLASEVAEALVGVEAPA